MSAFNQKQGTKALYQIQRCVYTKLHSTQRLRVELAKGLKPRGQGTRFLMELGSWGKETNFSSRRRKCLEIPLLHTPSSGCCASLLLFSQLHCFFRPIKELTDWKLQTEHFTLTTAVNNNHGCFTYRNFKTEVQLFYYKMKAHCPFHEGISTANKPLAQNNPSSFTPSFNLNPGHYWHAKVWVFLPPWGLDEENHTSLPFFPLDHLCL